MCFKWQSVKLPRLVLVKMRHSRFSLYFREVFVEGFVHFLVSLKTISVDRPKEVVISASCKI